MRPLLHLNISVAFTLTLNEVKGKGLSEIFRRFAPQDKLNQCFPLNGIPPMAGKMHC